MSVDTHKKFFFELKGKKVALWKLVDSASTDTVGSYRVRLPDSYYKNQLIYPDEAITNGLRFEYTALEKVFVKEDPQSTVDSSLTEDTSPSEESHVNLNRMRSLAVVDYIKAQINETKGDFQMKEYYMREFYKKLGDSESNMRSISINFPASPFSVK